MTVLSDVVDIYALKQIDPAAASIADGDRALVHGSNTSSSLSNAQHSGNTDLLVYYWSSASSAGADDIKVVLDFTR